MSIVLKELLKRPVAFHRIFVEIAGSVTAALFLSQACYWSEITEWEWFYKTQQDWEKETGLTRHEQDSARRKLVKVGVLEEVRRGVPAKMFYRIKLDILADLIAINRQTEIAINRQTEIAENRQTSLPETGNLYKEQETTTETTQRLPASSMNGLDVEKLFKHFCEVADKSSHYTLTPKRAKMAQARWKEALRIAKGDVAEAKSMIRDAIDALVSSTFHQDNGFVEWDQIFRSPENFTKWIDRAENPPDETKRTYRAAV